MGASGLTGSGLMDFLPIAKHTTNESSNSPVNQQLNSIKDIVIKYHPHGQYYGLFSTVEDDNTHHLIALDDEATLNQYLQCLPRSVCFPLFFPYIISDHSMRENYLHKLESIFEPLLLS